ncbi:PEGA domain-containing protein [Vulgatibacter sp.]|uniref:PEGA domain-containing protein n=1 Tax=Vulgatibacter sp. TaxID=1971226 RepID=UPI003566B951
MSPSCNLARFAATATAVVAVLCGPIAASAEKVKVLVVPYAPLYDSIPRATGAQIAETMEDGLANTDAVEIVQLAGEGESKAAAAATAEQIAAVEAARADWERGNKLLAKRKVKPALDAFEAAIKGMEANGPAMLDVAPLVDAHLKKAVALFLMGREDQAAKGPIPAALRLSPGVQLEAGRDFQQVFIDAVEKVRGEMQQAGYGQLRIDTTPPGAKIWIDEREAEYSPVLVSGIVPGTHYVKIKPPGADPYVQVIEIEKGELFRITPDDGKRAEGPVGSLVTLLAKNELTDAAKKQLAALVKKHGAQQAVLGAAYAQGANMGIVTYLYGAGDSGFTELQRITLDRDMLGATIEINKVATEIVAKLGPAQSPLKLPKAIASDARPGEEKINEVDFSGLFAAGVAGSTRAGEDGEVQPASTNKQPVSKDRRPITKRPAGGGLAPQAAAPAAGTTATPARTSRTPAGAPAPVAKPVTTTTDTGLVFKNDADFAPKQTAPEKPKYSYSAGTSIDDETAFEKKEEGGLLSQWWFWAGAGVLAAGAVGIGVAAAGSGADSATGSVRW